MIDVRDAFKRLRVDNQEQRFPPGHTGEFLFTYLTVLFGLVSGPLLWGNIFAG